VKYEKNADEALDRGIGRKIVLNPDQSRPTVMLGPSWSL